MTFAVRPISSAAIPRALEKAERYRLLNEPEQAESICRDVLAVEADHPQALVILVLALADQLGARHLTDVRPVEMLVAQLADPFSRQYYTGIVRERWARGLLAGGDPAQQAFAWLTDAMHCYEAAQALAPTGNDDAVLRYNTCVRTIARERLEEPAHAPDHVDAAPLRR